MATKTLVMGWFSFEKADATAGDLIAKNVVCEWLESAGRTFEVALAPPFAGGVSLASIDPATYSHVIFVCGPFFKTNLLRRYEGSKLVGVNLSMVEPVEEWNPFDLLLERDSSQVSRPDITFLAASESPLREARKGPAIGVVLMDPHEVPADSAHHEAANRAIGRIVESRDCSAVSIDTRLDIPNRSGLRAPAEVEAAIARTDLVLTTRLHGLVLAIKNRIPAVAVDPIPGGGKLTRQARAISWPLVFAPGTPKADLERAFDLCLTAKAVGMAERSRARALETLADTRAGFIDAMKSASGDDWGDGRRRRVWVETAADQPAPGWGWRVVRRLSAAVRRR
jgi:Polysaccharide pyruvyl transferase